MEQQIKMLIALFNRLLRLTGQRRLAPDRSDFQFDVEHPQASFHRVQLKRHLAGRSATLLPELLRQAGEHGWSMREQDKFQAYCEFFLGHAAKAYQRVLAGQLHVDDYPLMITACTYCYLFDRYTEGFALLESFPRTEVPEDEKIEFLAYAGYLAAASGQGLEKACHYFDEGLAGDVNRLVPLFAVNAYPLYFEAGRHQEVAKLREIIHQRFSQDPEAVFSLAMVELAKDYYPEGFRLAESRYRMPGVENSINNSLLTRPRWAGESLVGKRLLVHGEQGVGDLLMMARYLPGLSAMAGTILVDARPEVISVLEESFPDCVFVVGDNNACLNIDFDYWVGCMSLPFYFNTTRYDVPHTEGYLRIPLEQARYWKRRVAELASLDQRKIGVAWSGNPGHRADKRRSIPPGVFFEYLGGADASVFTLQTHGAESIFRSEKVPKNLIDVSEELVTFADTAALIAEMDIVITVDTSVVHLAGALGVDTWLLLPSRYEWRWGLIGERNNWYSSVRVFRQIRDGDWEEPLNKVFNCKLPEFLGRKSG